MKNNNTTLYCTCCKKKINVNATVCPNCGKTDPFFAKEAEKGQSPKISEHIMAFVVAIVITKFFIGGYGIKCFILFMALYLILMICGYKFKKFIFKAKIDKLTKEMNAICEEMNDKETFNNWKKISESY